MEKRIIIFLMMLVMASSAYSLDCIPLTDGMKISASNVLVCADTYSLPNGITVMRDGVHIDFNGAIIEGSLQNSGITVKGVSDVVIEDVSVTGYDFGILAEEANISIVDAKISDNVHGIHSYMSPIALSNVIYERNEEDFYDANVDTSVPVSDVDYERQEYEEVEVFKPYTENFENVVDESIIDEIGIRKGYEYAEGNVNISRNKTINEKTVEYSFTVVPNSDVRNLKVYEVIPKELVEHSYLIEASHEFEVVKEDPIIVFKFGDVKEGDKHTVVYKISKPELTEVNPFSVASIERLVNPSDSKIIRVLFATALILFLVNSFIKREINEIKKE